MLAIRRDNKDRLFRRIFGYPDNKENLLSLYNALNGTNYTNADDLEINTIDDVIYMGMKNDVSCIIDNYLMLLEHQGSYNPNMPLRGLLYFARQYDKYVAQYNLNRFGKKLVKIPTPRYFVLYNGSDEMPDCVELKLSDAFINPDETKGFEWTATMMNINYGKNRELMAACRVLEEYSIFVSMVKEALERKDAGSSAGGAISLSVDRAISDGILRDFLTAHKAEVVGMFLTEYDEEKTMELFKAEAREEAWEESRAAALNEITNMQNWLYEQGRDDDLIRTIKDKEFCSQMLEEYKTLL